MWWRRKNNRFMTFAQYVALSGIIKQESVDALRSAPYGGRIGRHEVPARLDGLMVGQLAKTQRLFGKADTIIEGVRYLSELSQREIDRAPAQDVIAFANAVTAELERIAKMFDSVNVPPTDEERRAGIEQLGGGGWFGLIDWYAKRMGIVNHDYVAECVPWMHLWQCMRIDAQQALFQRRLQKVMYNSKVKK